MKNILRVYRIPILLSLFLAILHFSARDLTNPYQKPITGDARGYYSYLPALLIYQDLDYSFMKEMDEKYYIPNRTTTFIREIDGEKFDKFFPGAALLYTPFFLLAHGIALISGLEADGYSYIYQLFFDIGFWFYFFLALVMSIKVLRLLKVDQVIANWSLTIVILGTNIFFYSVYDVSTTHIYNFFLISAFIYFLLQFKEDSKIKWLYFAFIVLGLIGITRPTNVLALLLVPIFIPELSYYKKIYAFFKRFKNVLFAGIIFCVFLSIPLILWKMQTGHWIIYSYGHEKFNFSDPHPYLFLFSYVKGWFLYSPIALLILIPGSILLYKLGRIQLFYGILFYTISIYIFSSWWAWHYGAGMGQRVVIDFSILLIFLLSLILNFIRKNSILRFSFLILCFLLIGLNIAQAYQIKNGIITNSSPTKEEYWDTFLSFEKKARVYPFEHWELIEKVNLLTKKEGTINLSPIEHYSEVLKIPYQSSKKGSKLMFSFEAKATDPIKESRCIIKLDALNPGNEFTFFLGTYTKSNEWVLMEFLVEPLSEISGETHLYFWNATTNETISFRNIKMQHYFTDGYY